ncbi:MAG: amino acid ABC transporter permease [Herbiconiux sp.]|nr:amino acid ABC transporter permease [Herbiconiux sp.]
MTLDEFVSWIPQLLPGLGSALLLTVVSLVIALPIGMLVGYTAELSRSRALRTVLIVLVELARGLPALVVLYLVYYGLPSLSVIIDSFGAVIIAFAFSNIGYISEIMRGAVRGVPVGQFEACAALGIPRWQALRSVTVPQTLRIATPSLVNYAAIVFQSTTIAITVAQPELLSAAYNIGSITFLYLPVFALAGAMYALVVILTSRAAAMIGRRLAY